jgi:hypothetical protein
MPEAQDYSEAAQLNERPNLRRVKKKPQNQSFYIHLQLVVPLFECCG